MPPKKIQRDRDKISSKALQISKNHKHGMIFEPKTLHIFKQQHGSGWATVLNTALSKFYT